MSRGKAGLGAMRGSEGVLCGQGNSSGQRPQAGPRPGCEWQWKGEEKAAIGVQILAAIVRTKDRSLFSVMGATGELWAVLGGGVGEGLEVTDGLKGSLLLLW